MAKSKVCEICNETYSRKPRWGNKLWERQRFCSKSCAGRFRKPIKIQPTKECLICGTVFSKNPRQRNEWWQKARFCSTSCRDIEFSVFMETVRYRGKQNWTWRKTILERDKYLCRMSNDDCRGNLTVHHILRYSEFPELRYDINNGITLCNFHHPLKRKEEKALESMFRSLINQNGN